MNPDIFREYDIRGVTGEDLNDRTVWIIARSLGTYFRQKNAKRIAVGYDARESSPHFKDLLIKGLHHSGCDVLEIGRVPTPVLYYTTYAKNVDGGVMVTGSHNPPDHNGFKICLGKEALYGPAIQEIKDIALKASFLPGHGSYFELDVLSSYKREVFGGFNFGNRKIKVVIDAGNGMGGVTALPIYKALGIKTIELFCEPDSSFPNHPPDPSQEENLQELIATVLKNKADLGIAFDGDADRITIIDEKGRVIWGDELLILFAREVLDIHHGAVVIAEVKCTQRLFDEIERLGGLPLMERAGHSIIKKRMRDTGAILAGEMSGHIFFADRYFGYDDGAYAGARLMEILSKSDLPLSDLIGLPDTFSTPEIRIPCPEEMKRDVIAGIVAEFGETNEVNTIDGARIKFEHGWGLVRPSNTQALMILRFEADSEENLAAIREKVEAKVKELTNLKHQYTSS